MAILLAHCDYWSFKMLTLSTRTCLLWNWIILRSFGDYEFCIMRRMKEACQQNDGGKINKTCKSWSNIGKTYVDHISLGSNRCLNMYMPIHVIFSNDVMMFILSSHQCVKEFTLLSSFKFIHLLCHSWLWVCDTKLCTHMLRIRGYHDVLQYIMVQYRIVFEILNIVVV